MSDQSPFGGQFDLDSLFAQAQQMGEQLMAAQAQAASEEHEGVAGGGAVRVTVTGSLEFRSVTISAEAVDPDDVEMLQDLVLAALNDAMTKVAGAQRSGGLDLGALGGLGGLDLGGLGGGLSGLLGGGVIDVGEGDDLGDHDDDHDDEDE